MLTDIVNQTATAESPFEESAFSFIQHWSRGAEVFIQETSGSTGKPKSILITREQMAASARLTQKALQLKAAETALVCLDTAYIAGKMMIVRAFENDMQIVIVEPSLNPFKNSVNDIIVDFAAFVPAQLSAILNSEEKHRLNEIKNIIVGGAALPESLINMISAIDARVFATYGMTETISHIALRPINGANRSEYFTVLPGIRVNTDDRGCLQAEVPFLNGQIITNDIVEMKSATEFRWIGRYDNVINSGGIKIIPEVLEGEIRKAFDAMQIQNRFLVSSLPDVTLGSKVVLIIEGNLPITVDRLHSSLKEILPLYHAPKQIFVNTTFEMTKNGKVNRKETIKKIGI